jgi:lysozyme
MDLDALYSDLRRDEGVRLRPYVDSVGKVTIGCGRNLSDVGISDAEVTFLLHNDVSAAISDLDRNAPWWRTLSKNRQRALANMCFNMGWPRLSGFQKMLTALREGRWDDAAQESLDSRWADQTDGKIDGKDGQRAQRIAEMIRHG